MSAENFYLQPGVKKAFTSLFFAQRLHRVMDVTSYGAMGPWRRTMRELSAEARLHLHARSLTGLTRARIHLIALYSALALIAGVVFGTLSVHPF